MPGLAAPLTSAVLDHAEESARMKTAIGLEDVTIYPVVEQQGPFFDAMGLLPTLTNPGVDDEVVLVDPTEMRVIAVIGLKPNQ